MKYDYLIVGSGLYGAIFIILKNYFLRPELSLEYMKQK